MRGLGEPIWAERSADELVECQQHESLLNLAFAEADGFRLQCPYDTEALPSDVIDEARHSHPLLVEGDVTRSSDEYRGTDTLAHPRGSLPVPRGPAEEMAFDRYRLDLVRRLVEEHAEAAALVGIRAEDLVVAVNEVASNSVKHGGGNGVVRIWCEPGTILCEVRDSGRVDEPLAGRRRPVAGAIGGHGLWIAHQLCDLVQVRSVRGGTVVRLHMLLPSG
jgi:anti-sigma regulatory factor (Ser/Thr protein kinase)